jgi:hypothetical protein
MVNTIQKESVPNLPKDKDSDINTGFGPPVDLKAIQAQLRPVEFMPKNELEPKAVLHQHVEAIIFLLKNPDFLNGDTSFINLQEGNGYKTIYSSVGGKLEPKGVFYSHPDEKLTIAVYKDGNITLLVNGKKWEGDIKTLESRQATIILDSYSGSMLAKHSAMIERSMQDKALESKQNRDTIVNDINTLFMGFLHDKPGSAEFVDSTLSIEKKPNGEPGKATFGYKNVVLEFDHSQSKSFTPYRRSEDGTFTKIDELSPEDLKMLETLLNSNRFILDEIENRRFPSTT